MKRAAEFYDIFGGNSLSTTYAIAKAKVQRDLDLEDEVFIQAQEMLDYFNEARREAEAEVLAIYEDYFLTYAYLPLTLGTALYNLPSGIYAQKIRGIIYQNVGGDLIYPIDRIRTAKKFLDRAYLLNANPTDYYKYIIVNDATSGFQIELVPAAKETSSQNVRIWYLRKVVDIANDSDVIDSDIPESLNFIYAYVKGRCKQKENMGNMPEDARAEIEMQRKLLVDTLTTAIPDDDDEIVKDLSTYQDHS